MISLGTSQYSLRNIDEAYPYKDWLLSGYWLHRSERQNKKRTSFRVGMGREVAMGLGNEGTGVD